MERAALVAKRDAIGSRAGGSLGKRGEVLDGIRHGVAVKAKDDSTGILSIELEVEEDFLGDGIKWPWGGRLFMVRFDNRVLLSGRSLVRWLMISLGDWHGFVGDMLDRSVINGVSVVDGSAKCIGMAAEGATIAWNSWFFRNNWIFKATFTLRSASLVFDVREGGDAWVEVGHLGMRLALLEAIEHAVEIEGIINDVATVEIFGAGRGSGWSIKTFGVTADVAG